MKRFKSSSKLNWFKEPLLNNRRKISDKVVKKFDFYSQKSTNFNSNASFWFLMRDNSDFNISSDIINNNAELYKRSIPLPVSNSISRLQKLVSPYSKKSKRRNIAWYENSENLEFSPFRKINNQNICSPKVGIVYKN